MNIAFVGEVDHGKSSLIGRLLLDTKSLPLDKLKEFNTISKELGADACLAFLLDQLLEEREGLLTIDTTEIVLKIKNKSFICIDTPGHLKFLKNMMTGTSHADAALIVVDALCGVQEQTLLHAHILELFGIKSVIFAVNKMDLVNYQEGPFRLIENALEILSKKSGIIPQAIIPVSAQYAINITQNSEKTKWYKGRPLAWTIAHLKGPLTGTKKPLRLPVQDIYQVDGRPVIVGRPSQGTVSKNQKILVSPSMQETQINDIKIFGQKITSACKGENVGVCLSTPVQIKRGDVLCGLDAPLPGTRRFQAQILWLAEGPVKNNESVTIQIATQQFPCAIKNIKQTLNASTYNIDLESDRPVAVEPFVINNELGRFVIEEKGKKVGAGIITKILSALIFCITVAGMNTFPANVWAQTKIEDQSANMNDLGDLQALSYLQGYNSPTKFKNVTLYDKKRSYKGYNLLVSAHAPEATLMDMNGNTVFQWHYPSASLQVEYGHVTDHWARARILKNGDLLALLPYSGFIKINKNSRLIWFRKIACHHDFDTDSDGNIYTLTVKRMRLANRPGPGIKVDSITVLSPQGETKKEISLYDLLKKYPDPVYINKIDRGNHLDAFHSNSIQVLDGKWAYKIPAFKKGNLLISIRNLGIIICVDPDKEEIVWLMDTAFWNKGQHFSHLLDNGNILLFDNYDNPTSSRVVEFNPFIKKTVWDYSNQNGPFFSSILGQCYRLPNGNTLITDSVNGHSFEVTPDKKIVWEYYNPHLINNNSSLFHTINSTQHWTNGDKKLVAVTYQMQRIPVDSNLDWLKN